MGNPATISVIIPCYNQARFLTEALGSVKAQTFQDWECIIVNDGSPDNTADVAREWVKKDSRFRYVEKPNGGLSSARNAGIESARGRLLQFLDADDALHPRKLELQVAEAARATGMVVVCCDFYYSSEQDLKVRLAGQRLAIKLHAADPLSDLAIRWETQLSIPCHCFLFDARLFLEHKIRFDESLPNHEDWDCWMQIFACMPALGYVDEELAIYRVHPSSMCRNRGTMRRGFLKAIRKQQRLLRKNRELVLALKAKRREVKRAYADGGPFANLRHILRGVVVAIAKRVLPGKCWNRVKAIRRSIS